MSDGGKGSGRRPTQVNQKEFSNNWEMIFGKKDKQKENTNNHQNNDNKTNVNKSN